jgi:uncharacterized membrane protein YdbT with pleckstrin-like domain
MSLIYCASCEGKCSSELDKCPHCGHPIKAQQESSSSNEEQTLFIMKPKMFRDKPLTFLFGVILLIYSIFGITDSIIYIIITGITVIVMLWWWLKCVTTELKVSNKIAILKHGIIAKHTSELRHNDIKNIIVNQSFQQRIFGVGTISLSSAGQSDLEIVISGIKKPQEVVKQIRALQC